MKSLFLYQIDNTKGVIGYVSSASHIFEDIDMPVRGY